MRVHTIKFKITCWYTGMITVLFGVVLVGALWYSGRYSEDAIWEELRDEVRDLQESIFRYSLKFPLENSTLFFDDGVMLSIYDEETRFVDGIFPEDFPGGCPLVQGDPRRIRRDDESWFVYDEKVVLPDGEGCWIRGIYSYSSLVSDNLWIVRIVVLLFPLIAVFAALIGHRMLVSALRPVHTVTETANEITSSMTLSRRIPVPQSKDEIYELCLTFNQMLESLERNFFRERQFSSDAAHELRTPVSVILSHCEYCLEELSLPEEAAGEIQIIRRKAMQMSELVSRLLLISRSEKKSRMEKEEVDLALLAETVAEELREKAEQKGITIETDNQLENTVILADMSMLTRLFINLIDNAIVYGRRQGYVRIRMTEKEDRIFLRFEDNGIGISPEDQERIWDRFYQVDASRTRGENFGLGLFMVRQIAEWHGGTVSVESRPARGSVFTVVLPRRSGRAETGN